MSRKISRQQGLPPVRIYMDAEFRKRRNKLDAVYSLVLESGKDKAVYHGNIKNTTEDRAILWITYKALSHLNKKCCIEVHAPGKYLDAGFNLCRFQTHRDNQYQGTINADLIEKLLKMAAGHSISVVSEEKNKYSDWSAKERKQEIPAKRKEKVIDDGR